MDNPDQPNESRAVAAIKADAAEAAKRFSALHARLTELAKTAPGEVALSLVLAQVADPRLAPEALALGDSDRSLTVSSVAQLIGAPDLAVELWSASIRAGVTGKPVAVTLRNDKGEPTRFTFNPPTPGAVQ
ncbi:MAG TPA: hypothetical protein DDZ68_04480 [Parvularcula sp.]|nr:hypothetical protein [Parvularcula sp.]HBS31227.1 hypothetical protein [Parvularcula sp.]